jgi:hypothetical protein
MFLLVVEPAVHLLKDCIPHVLHTSSHCVLHRQALVDKTPGSLMPVLDNEIPIFNFIKTRPSYFGLFKLLCNDMGSECQTLNFSYQNLLAVSR